MEPQEYLEIACKIAEVIDKGQTSIPVDKLKEPWIRTAISRSYYSAFLKARRKTSLEHEETAKVHSMVINKLREKGYYQTANRLAELRNLRNNADYDTHLTITIQKLKWAISTAKYIHQALEIIPMD